MAPELRPGRGGLSLPLKRTQSFRQKSVFDICRRHACLKMSRRSSPISSGCKVVNMPGLYVRIVTTADHLTGERSSGRPVPGWRTTWTIFLQRGPKSRSGFFWLLARKGLWQDSILFPQSGKNEVPLVTASLALGARHAKADPVSGRGRKCEEAGFCLQRQKRRRQR